MAKETTSRCRIQLVFATLIHAMLTSDIKNHLNRLAYALAMANVE